MILEAEGRRESAHRDAEARERLAQAEAKATTDVSVAINKGSVQAINYFVAQKYVEAMHAFAHSPNQKVMLMPMEVSSVIGSIAGIAEVAKEAFADRMDSSQDRGVVRSKPKTSVPSGGKSS
jgi:regulator of protease activity HflC (stomatin/prohibitin superfamily)